MSVQTQVVNVFKVGDRVSFIYDGKIRVGEVSRLTPKCVTLKDFLRNDFRSFRVEKINRVAKS